MSIGKLTAYLTPDTLAATALNALANAGYAWTAEIDNSTDLYPYGAVSLGLSGTATGTAPSYLAYYLAEPDDGGNYVGSSGDPGGNPVISWRSPTNALTTTGRLLIGRLLPPKFKLVLFNGMGTSGTFPANNSAAWKLHRFADQIV